MNQNQKTYSEDLRWVLVHMHQKRNMSINEIERITNLKPRTIRRVLKLFEKTGKVLPPEAKSGQPRKLDENDVDVSIGYVTAYFFHILKECPFTVSQILYRTFCRLVSRRITKSA